MTQPLNTPHVVTVGAPPLRPGLTISATCSEKYVPEVAKRLLEIARAINGGGETFQVQWRTGKYDAVTGAHIPDAPPAPCCGGTKGIV